jgi:signal transduction histidine kinase
MLKSLTTDFASATQMQILTHLPDHLPNLSEAQRNALYRTAQEGLTNAQRHARATCVTLTVEPTADSIRLIIHDDGIGFDPASRASGIGLHGMREQANHLRGHLEIDSRPGQGTTLTLTLPLREEGVYA